MTIRSSTSLVLVSPALQENMLVLLPVMVVMLSVESLFILLEQGF